MHRINWGVGGMMYDFVNYVYVWHVLFHMNELMIQLLQEILTTSITYIWFSPRVALVFPATAEPSPCWRVEPAETNAVSPCIESDCKCDEKDNSSWMWPKKFIPTHFAIKIRLVMPKRATLVQFSSVHITFALRITGPCYRGVWILAGVWDLQTTRHLRSRLILRVYTFVKFVWCPTIPEASALNISIPPDLTKSPHDSLS